MPILVVDDFPLVAATIAGLLRAEGFRHVDVAHGGSAALEKLEGRPYRLVVSDLKMPGVGGLELLKAMRENEHHQKTRFLLITADQSSAVVQDAERAGVDGILSKPFSPERLRGIIDGIFSEVQAGA
jgi:two-component system chemotaxis response regulator CheY